MKAWYALHTKPRKEAVVAKQLVARKIDHYFPMEVHAMGKKAKPFRPFFPGYLFVCIDIEEAGFNTIHYIPFTYGVVCYGTQPAPVPGYFIRGLRESLADQDACPSKPAQVFHPGDKIKVTEGLFEGLEGLFKDCRSGSERAVVLLHFIQDQFKSVEIPMRHIQHRL